MSVSATARPQATEFGRFNPNFQKPAYQSDADWKTETATAETKIESRRKWAERFKRTSNFIGNVNVASILGGSAVLLTDSLLENFLDPVVRENIVNTGVMALSGSLVAQLSTNVASEVVIGPDKKLDEGVDRMMSTNKFGGKQLAAKLGKWGGNVVKWGSLAVAGLATAEGLIGQDPLGGSLEALIPNSDILKNIPNIEPSMAFPAIALAAGGEIAHRLFSKQDEVYKAAADFVTLNSKADKKTTEAKQFNVGKETLKKGGIKNMVWSKLLTGDIPDAIWWYLQKGKFDIEGKVGVASATLSEIVRAKASLPEKIITGFTRYNTWPFIAAGITGLVSPALSGPLAEAMEPVDPAIWAGLALTGVAKYQLFDKPQAQAMEAMQYAAIRNLDSGRPSFAAQPI